MPPASIMERISASKGLISPMMARLAAAALKPSAAFDPGEQAGPCPGSKHLTDPRCSLALGCRAEWGECFAEASSYSLHPSPLLLHLPALPWLCLPPVYFLLGLLILTCPPQAALASASSSVKLSLIHI